ncbi:TetR/AcrR family transcriptional regulator [Actinokineospora sp. 24-640]
MPRRNPERRAALLDATVAVLAGEGARGLTFRAVDAAAGVPTGTASNYFPSRDALLTEVGEHVHHRLAPDPATVDALLARPRDKRLVEAFMRDILARVTRDRAGYLALLELRLEATRNPALHKGFGATMADQLRSNVAFHLEADLPGDAVDVTVLYLAMTGLVVEQLTLPDMLPDAEGLIRRMTERLT